MYFLGKFELVEQIKRLGPLAVYRAIDSELGRPVILKTVELEPKSHTETSTAPEASQVRNLLTEARATASLEHPRLASIYETGTADGHWFLAMECIAGPTLERRLADGPLPIAECLALALDLIQALDALHRQNLVHCDVHPGNIVLDPRGARLIDLGSVTTAGEISTTVDGTPGYMAPEQICGESLGPAADIFGLGAVLYLCLTGRAPFAGDLPLDRLDATLHQEPRRVGEFRDEIPLRLEDAVRRSLAKRPADRFPSAIEFAEALSPLREGAAKSAAPSSGLRTERIEKSSVPVVHAGRWVARLLERLRQRASERPATVSTPIAFKGLSPFLEHDREVFFGRQRESILLAERVLDEGPIVLFGNSGCGKTSLLRAGLMPLLRERGWLPIYCRAYGEPLASLLEEVTRQSGIGHLESESPLSFLRRVEEEMDAGLVLLADQLEELFVQIPDSARRAPFLRFLADVHKEPGLRCRILMSVRSDFLYRLHLVAEELGDWIEEPLSSSRAFHLRGFARSDAELVFRESARRADLPLPADLARILAADLEDQENIRPAELQIVGEQLQRLRIADLDTYRRAGGHEALLERHLEDVLEATGEPDAACLVLVSLISEEETRLTLTLDAIAERCPRDPPAVERLLRHLVAARLVREIQDSDPWRYELVHEILIRRILRASGKIMDAKAKAERLLRQFLARQAGEPSARLPLLDLLRVYRHLRPKEQRVRELLRSSLRRAVLLAGLWAFLLVSLSLGVAFWQSLREDWIGVRLRDGHTAAARRATFSPDGQLLASAGEDGQVLIWDARRRHLRARLADHEGWVKDVKYSHDGRFLASTGVDGQVLIYDAETLKPVDALDGLASEMSRLTFSPDGRWLVSIAGDAPQPTRLWQVGSWRRQKLAINRPGSGDVLFDISSRYLMLLTGTVWDLSEGVQVQGEVDPALSTGFGDLSPDGQTLASVTGQGFVLFWSTREFIGSSARQPLKRHRAHRDIGRAAAFSGDGRWLATGAEDIVLWDAVTREPLARLSYPSIVWSLDFSPDALTLVSSHGDGSVMLWDVEGRERAADLGGHAGPVRALAFSHDGSLLLTASEDRSVIVWNLESQRKEAVLVGHETRVNGVAASPDRRVVSADQDGELFVWDLDSETPLVRFNHPKVPRRAYVMALSPNGRWLACSYGIFELEHRRLEVDFHTSELYLNTSLVYGVAFSDDNRLVVATSALGRIALWSTADWRPVDYLDVTGAPLLDVAFSPAGDLLVTAEDTGAVRLWSVKPLQQLAVLGRHAARVKSVAFSPDGRHVISTGDDQVLALWDVAKRRLERRIGNHSSPVLSAAFSPSGRYLAAGLHDGSVWLYERQRSRWGRRLDGEKR